MLVFTGSNTMGWGTVQVKEQGLNGFVDVTAQGAMPPPAVIEIKSEKGPKTQEYLSTPLGLHTERPEEEPDLVAETEKVLVGRMRETVGSDVITAEAGYNTIGPNRH